MKKGRFGFTLIELLVVISIIGLLASITLVSVNSARGKALDAKALITLREYDRVFHQFFLDNGYYPIVTSDPNQNGESCIGNDSDSCMEDSTTVYVNQSFRQSIDQYYPGHPTIDTGPVTLWSNSGNPKTFIGATYSCAELTADGNGCIQAIIRWAVRSTSCPIGTLEQTDGINAICNFIEDIAGSN